MEDKTIYKLGNATSILGCLPDYEGSQKCHISHDLFKKFNTKLGQTAFIYDNKKVYICSLWPRKDSKSTQIQLDRFVYVDKSSEHFNGSIKSSIKICQCTLYTRIKVHIVIVEYKKVQYFKNHQVKLKQFIQDILQFISFASNCVINASHHPLGKLYGIANIIVESVNCLNECPCGQINEDTTIEICKVESKERYEQRIKLQSLCLGGLSQAKSTLRQLIELALFRQQAFKQLGVKPQRSVVLCGPPGTGKTSLVKLVTLECEAHLLTVVGPELSASRPGETEHNLREIFEKALVLSEEGGCILFLDEIDSFCAKKGKGGNPDRRILSQLLMLLDRVNSKESNVVVVAATNRPGDLDPALRRPGRLDKEIFLGIPNQQQRQEILQALTCDHCMHPDVNLSNIAEGTPGFVGADLRLLVQQAYYSALKSCDYDHEELQITAEDLKLALHNITPTSQKGSDVFIDHRPVQWEDIGGLDAVKMQIKQAIELPIKHPDAFRRLGLPYPKGVLLYGPPGCAKTTLVRAAATCCHVTFLSVSGAQLYSPFVGDSEKKVAEIFQQARAGAPCILFLDEIDSLVGSRSKGSKQGSVQERVLSTLLNEMDGIGLKVDTLQNLSHGEMIKEGEQSHKQNGHVQMPVNNSSVLVVAATNRPDMLDDAILRPGRIDKIIYVPPPDKQAREEILKVYSSKMNADSGLDLSSIADKTENYTGADLENLCREAALHALTIDGLDVRSVRQEHFYAVLSALSPSLSAEQVQQYSRVRHGQSAAATP